RPSTSTYCPSPTFAPTRTASSAYRCKRSSTMCESDAGRRAAAGDVEVRGRDAGHANAERVALPVEVSLADERHAPRQRGHVAEHVRNGDREAQVDERLRDLSVADSESPVARHPGQDAAARIDDAEVVNAGHVDAVVDGRHEIVGRL